MKTMHFGQKKSFETLQHFLQKWGIRTWFTSQKCLESIFR